MEREDLAKRIEAACATPPPHVSATILQKVYDTDSLPLLVTASDGHEYVVKLPWVRTHRWRRLQENAHDGGSPLSYTKGVMVNEQTVGRVANAVEAPVPRVALVDISPEFLAVNEADIRKQLREHGFPGADTHKYEPGVAHGSAFMTTLGSRQGFDFIEDVPQNRPRVAKIAVLYGLVGIKDDLQCFYDRETRLAYSVDHGFAFEGVPFWTVLSANSLPVGACQAVISSQKLSPEEIAVASEILDYLSEMEVVQAVAGAPEDWDFDLRKRTRAATYILKRKDAFPQLREGATE